jgi:hypothetical protein
MKNVNQILNFKDIRLTHIDQCPSSCFYRRNTAVEPFTIYRLTPKSCAQLSRLLFPLNDGDGKNFIKCISAPEIRRLTDSSVWVVNCLIIQKLLFVAQSI